MSDLETGKKIELALTTPAIETESATPMAGVEDSNPKPKVGSSRNAAAQSEEKAKGKVCGVCSDHEARYKCSRCQLPYCSVACATLHRATHPAVDDDDAPPTKTEVRPAIRINGQVVKHTPGTISATASRNPFTVLDEAKELHTLFIMYPRLRSQLREIYTATLPPSDDSQGILGHYEDQSQSHRGRGRGRGRGRNGRGRDRTSWNTDRGTQDGIDALCSAKEQYGKGGEGVREYAELILKLVSMEGVDVAQLVQEEVAEENAKIIAQLLNGDSLN